MYMHSAPTIADAGIVINQAATTLPATLQRTSENRFDDPTPSSDDVVTCVVLMGAPKRDAVKITPAVALWDAKPWTGRMRRIFCPIVLIILQPPLRVPSMMTAAQAIFTHAGI